MSEIGDRLRRFISSELMFVEDGSVELSDDTPLLGGVIDSLDLMQLISFIEEEFEVAIDAADVRANNFRTVSDIERLIEQKVQVG